MLLSLPAECRQLIGAVAAHVKRRKYGRNVLRQKEIRDGVATLMLNWEGGVERIVSVIVIRLRDAGGRCLLRLGSLTEDDRIETKLDLPGCKQTAGETSEQALARFPRGTFAPLAPNISCTGVQREEAWKESQRTAVKTKYLKTV